MDSFNTLGLHYFCCSFMTGLIWIIQIVYCPSFKFLDKNKLDEFERFHIKRITFLMGPVMLLELISGLVLFYLWKEIYFWPMLINILLLAFIWLVTIFVSKPYLRRLLKHFDIDLLQKLIRTNWIRTILWSIRCLILAPFVF
ncbi:MAG: hypothetical protein DRQ88_08255 [Epsilonproteobacteria bacterium]|nr:MAG: hypothetical protein DRQ89_08990 [Campylobacterota bacterium]RLA65980.1 MAG: hypothetical protein DRQ88_08255 [Campylobacterota bacterium]